ncbi:hypothetical protein BJY54_005944 [Streptomyces nodosus]|nr:hypothetical protein [Streptomyces nodosus]
MRTGGHHRLTGTGAVSGARTRADRPGREESARARKAAWTGRVCTHGCLPFVMWLRPGRAGRHAGPDSKSVPVIASIRKYPGRRGPITSLAGRRRAEPGVRPPVPSSRPYAGRLPDLPHPAPYADRCSWFAPSARRERRKREPGGNPGLPRSGERERPPSYALGPVRRAWEATATRCPLDEDAPASPKTCPLTVCEPLVRGHPGDLRGRVGVRTGPMTVCVSHTITVSRSSPLRVLVPSPGSQGFISRRRSP